MTFNKEEIDWLKFNCDDELFDRILKNQEKAEDWAKWQEAKRKALEDAEKLKIIDKDYERFYKIVKRLKKEIENYELICQDVAEPRESFDILNILQKIRDGEE